MQRIVLKKEIKAKYPVDGISLVNLEDEIDYQCSNDGIYANGVIKLSGEYYKGVRTTKFADEIDIDVFAPIDDLVSRNELKVKIIDFDYKIDQDMIFFSVVVDIDGLKDLNKTFPSTDIQEKEEVLVIEEDRADSDNADLVDEEVIQEEVVEEKTQLEEEIKELQNKKEEILKPKSTKTESKVCWSFHVVMKDDTYESIASDLSIDVEKLRTLNQDRNLSEGMLIVLP